MIQDKQKIISDACKKEVGLRYLFFSFLKTGATSWGGYMAMISVIQHQMANKNKVIKNEKLLDAIALASVLPGPMAFNIVAYIGYHLRGCLGAVVSMIAVTAPSFVLILILATMYYSYGQLAVFTPFFKGVLPAVTAVICGVALTMALKQIKDFKQLVICVVSATVLSLSKGFFSTFLIIIAAAILGGLLYGKFLANSDFRLKKINKMPLRKTMIFAITMAGIFLLIYLFPLFFKERLPTQILIQRDLITVFSGMSLSLFGGGYVMIPFMQQIIVDNLQWLSTVEFADAIAMGQITPGPVFISAAFIGYKLGGTVGALTATTAVFLPSACLMIFCSGFMDRISGWSPLTAVFKGLRPAVIGMIFSSVFVLAKETEPDIFSFLIFISVLIFTVRLKISPVFLIPAAGVLTMLFYTVLLP